MPPPMHQRLLAQLLAAVGVRSNEPLDMAVLREVFEETGLRDVRVRTELFTEHKAHPTTGSPRTTTFFALHSPAQGRNTCRAGPRAAAPRPTADGLQRGRGGLLGLPRWMGSVQRSRWPLASAVPSAISVAVTAPVPGSSRCQARSRARYASTSGGSPGAGKSSLYSSTSI